MLPCAFRDIDRLVFADVSADSDVATKNQSQTQTLVALITECFEELATGKAPARETVAAWTRGPRE